MNETPSQPVKALAGPGFVADRIPRPAPIRVGIGIIRTLADYAKWIVGRVVSFVKTMQKSLANFWGEYDLGGPLLLGSLVPMLLGMLSIASYILLQKPALFWVGGFLTLPTVLLVLSFLLLLSIEATEFVSDRVKKIAKKIFLEILKRTPEL